jgi:hypothetical protein
MEWVQLTDCTMSHGTMKYTLKEHVCYFVLMVRLLHYLYSLHPDFYTSENIINIGNFFNNGPKIWYDWNIIESGVKHHKPNQKGTFFHCWMLNDIFDCDYVRTFVLSCQAVK